MLVFKSIPICLLLASKSELISNEVFLSVESGDIVWAQTGIMKFSDIQSASNHRPGSSTVPRQIGLGCAESLMSKQERKPVSGCPPWFLCRLPALHICLDFSEWWVTLWAWKLNGTVSSPKLPLVLVFIIETENKPEHWRLSTATGLWNSRLPKSSSVHIFLQVTS